VTEDVMIEACYVLQVHFLRGTSVKYQMTSDVVPGMWLGRTQKLVFATRDALGTCFAAKTADANSAWGTPQNVPAIVARHYHHVFGPLTPEALGRLPEAGFLNI
jgi:hypothetical protein